MLTSATGEVKLYLAVPSTSSSRLVLPGIAASPSKAASLAHRRSLARLVLGQARYVWKSRAVSRKLLEDLHDQEPQFDCFAGRLAVVSRAGVGARWWCQGVVP